MTFRSVKLLSLAIAVSLVVPANAFVWTIDNMMDGLQEVPPNNSPATGHIGGTYDDVSNLLTIHVVFQNLTSNETAAHIHKGAAGVSGGVIFPLPLGNPKDFQVVLDAAQETDILSNLYYVNIHTTVFPGGEIRGQITPVPEPATLVCAGVAIAALLRKRKK